MAFNGEDYFKSLKKEAGLSFIYLSLAQENALGNIQVAEEVPFWRENNAPLLKILEIILTYKIIRIYKADYISKLPAREMNTLSFLLFDVSSY